MKQDYQRSTEMTTNHIAAKQSGIENNTTMQNNTPGTAHPHRRTTRFSLSKLATLLLLTLATTLPTIANADPDTAICSGQRLRLLAKVTAGGTPNYQYVWSVESVPAGCTAAQAGMSDSPITNNTDKDTNSITIHPVYFGTEDYVEYTYSVVITDNGGSGCVKDNLSKTVRVYPMPNVSVTSAAENVICLGSPITEVPLTYDSHATLSTDPSLPSGVTLSTHNNGLDTIKGTPTAAQSETTYHVIGSNSYIFNTRTYYCKDTADIKITVRDTLSIPLLSSYSICENASTLHDTLELSVTAAAGYTYSWTLPSGVSVIGRSDTNSIKLQFASATSYNIQVTVTNKTTSCASHAKTTVTVNPAPTASITAVPTICPNVGSLQIYGASTATAANYTYTWGGDLTVTSTNPHTRSHLKDTATVTIPTTPCNTTYNVTLAVKDVNNCSSQTNTTVAVQDNAGPTIGTIGTRDTVDAVAAGTCKYKIPDLESTVVAASSDGCGGAITWVSQSPAKDEAYAQTGSVQYIDVTVTVEDGCNNPTSKVVRVRIPANTFTVNTIDSTYICGSGVGNAVPLLKRTLVTTPTNNYGVVSYSWTPTTGIAYPSTSTSQSPTVQPSATTRYVVTATDANGCIAKDSVKITVVPAIVPNLTVAPNPICKNETVTLTAAPTGGSGTYTGYTYTAPASDAPGYAWSVTPSTSSITPGDPASTATAVPSSTGTVTYRVVITDNMGCNNAQSVDVTVNDLPNLTINPSGSVNLSCYGDKIDILANTSSAAGQAPFSFALTTTDTPDDGDYVAASGTPPSHTFTNVDGGTGTSLTYYITLKNTYGCTDQKSITIYQPTELVPPAITVNSPICLGDVVTMSAPEATGGTRNASTPLYTYTWTASNGSTPASTTPPAGAATAATHTPTSATTVTYTLTVEDKNGCEKTSTANVVVNPLPTLSISNDNQIECHATDLVSSVVTVTNANITYTPTTLPTGISYDGETHTFSYASNLASGEYTIHVTATSNQTPGCGSVESDIYIKVYGEFVADDMAAQTKCYGTTATLEVTGMTGGQGTYEYQWQNQVSGAWTDITGAESSSYTTGALTHDTVFRVAITDAECGTIYKEVNVTVYDAYDLTNDNHDTTYCKNETADALTVTVAGGSTASYQWYGNGEVITGATTGSYTPGTTNASSDTTYTVKVSNGCQSDSVVVARVQVYDAYTLTNNNHDTTYCPNATAEALTVTVAGGSTASYQWYGNGEIITGATTGSYTPGTTNASSDTTYTVKVSNGCQSDSVVVARVQVYDAYTLTNSNHDTTYCPNATAEALTVTVAGGSTTRYQWYGNGEVITGATTGNYTPGTTNASSDTTYTVKVSNGCQSDSVVVARVQVWTLPVVNTTSISRDRVACMADTTAAVSDTNALAAIGFHFANGHNISQNVTVVSNSFTGDNCFGTRTTIYRATDECGNSVDVTYIQTVKDSIAPVKTGSWPTGNDSQNNCLASADLSVFLSNAEAKARYSDCSEMTVTHEQDTTGDNCGWTVRRMYVITDQCGNTSYDTIKVSGMNTVLPTITAIDDQDAIIAMSNCQYKIPNLNELTLEHSSDICGGPMTFVSQMPEADSLFDQTTSEQVIPVTVTVANECGLHQTATVNVIIPANDIQLTATDTAYICLGDSATLTAVGGSSNGGVTYEWTPATGLNTTTGNNVLASPSTDMAYTVRASDRNGCFLEQEVMVMIYPSLVLSADSLNQHVCAGGAMAPVMVNYAHATVAVTGLPNGITYDAVSGVISGHPHENGDYMVVATHVNGCGTDTLRGFITVNDTLMVIESDTSCDTYTWAANTQMYTTSGRYRFATQTANGCDSVMYLNLTVNYSNTGDTSAIVCEPFTWYGNTYDASAEPTHVFTNGNQDGCDSTLTLHLTVGQAYLISEADSMCAGGVYEYHGLSLTTEGTYSQTYPSMYDCDSVYSITLTVKPMVTIGIEMIPDCEMSQYIIIASTNTDTYEWSCSIDDGQIDAQRYNDTIRVAPPETATYTFTADRPATHFCTRTESITVNELLVPNARIDVGDQHISPDYAEWHAQDVSENGDFGREWYVNDSYYIEQGQTIYGTIAPDASETEVSLRLVVFSEHCSDTAEAVIPIVVEPVYVPNIFTPGEATNNLFGPEGDVITDCEMWIYSREGLLVFHSMSKDVKWDGTHQGRGTKCKQAAYTYKIKYRVAGQTTYRQKFGSVTLLW